MVMLIQPLVAIPFEPTNVQFERRKTIFEIASQDEVEHEFMRRAVQIDFKTEQCRASVVGESVHPKRAPGPQPRLRFEAATNFR